MQATIPKGIQWVVLSALSPKKFEKMAREATDICSRAVNTSEIPNHFTLIVFWCEMCDLLRDLLSVAKHSKGDIFTREDIKFSRESSPGISLVFRQQKVFPYD